MSPVACPSPTVSPGARAIGSCSGVSCAGGPLAGLGAHVPNVRFLVAGVGCPVVIFGCLVAIVSDPVPVLSGLVGLDGTVLILGAPGIAHAAQHTPVSGYANGLAVAGWYQPDEYPGDFQPGARCRPKHEALVSPSPVR